VKQQHTSTATLILTTKSAYRSLSTQRLSERTVYEVLDVTWCVPILKTLWCLLVTSWFVCHVTKLTSPSNVLQYTFPYVLAIRYSNFAPPNGHSVSFYPLTPELNPSAQRCLTRFFTGILLLEPCISLIYAWKTNKHTNYSFSLLIMYGSSYMFRHYIAILRERS
jgi:hypothetical protein